MRFPHMFLSLFGSPIGGVTARAAEFSIFRVDPGPGVSHRQRLRHPVCSEIRLSILVLSSRAYRAFDRTNIYLGGWVNTGSPRKKTPLCVRQRMIVTTTLPSSVDNTRGLAIDRSQLISTSSCARNVAAVERQEPSNPT